ncbi:acyl-CoA reductase-like NAD-dependent aldehyde dehydrogenase [Sphingobium fontiphilum]|uniref:Acyl-CoA reductase-like NAD-dependent aldehyde dehydrogenase n=1 Tax=Sphingobium fontiphilum TaxID=944425 RepID=A0A7W6DJ00_9SPHN|nr:acyl-CoA reductase-like NAD-dependent aldehyde dehydrogenase [Sphingobium fontiphilum]
MVIDPAHPIGRDDPGKMVALEMGDNKPLIMWGTLNMSNVAALIVQSAFTSAGQRCIAARRQIVKAGF